VGERSASTSCSVADSLSWPAPRQTQPSARARGGSSIASARVVSLEGLAAVRGEMDRLFEDHPAVLLRPDRFVFGVVDEVYDLDRLVAELVRSLSLI
jgi:hypothetical protein